EAAAQDFGAQAFVPHRLGPAPPQTCPEGHTPHDKTPLQPSSTSPHSALNWSHVAGVQPQRFATPLPPQVDGGVQDPQWSVWPQSFGTVPHAAPRSAHLVQAVTPSIPTAASTMSPPACVSGVRLPQPNVP